MKIFGSITLAFALAVAILTSGCGLQPKTMKTPAPVAKSETAHGPDHEHEEGPHGGTIADWGGGKYHVEFCMDHGKKEATVYLLKADAKTPAPIKAETISLAIKKPAVQLDLKADPQKDDPKGTSSKFVGTHEAFAKEQEFAGTISGQIDGKPYTGDFEEEAHDHKEKKK